jgi:hypothetical protein
VIINIRPWSTKKSGSHLDTKEPGLIWPGGLVQKGGLVCQRIRYSINKARTQYMNPVSIYEYSSPRLKRFHLPAPPRVVFTSLFGCAFFTSTMDDKIMGEK